MARPGASRQICHELPLGGWPRGMAVLFFVMLLLLLGRVCLCTLVPGWTLLLLLLLRLLLLIWLTSLVI